MIHKEQTCAPLVDVKSWVAVGPSGAIAVLTPLYKRSVTSLAMGIRVEFEGDEPVAVIVEADEQESHPMLCWSAIKERLEILGDL